MHLIIRQAASAEPRQGPCLRTASSAYAEHEGSKRQFIGISGPSTKRYALMRATMTARAALSIARRIFRIGPARQFV